MVKKSSVMYVCSNCESTIAKWIGKCHKCNEWNSFIPISEHQKNNSLSFDESEITKISDVDIEDYDRLNTGCTEFNRVTGGGIVPGSLTLLAGEPGVGKSTLVLSILEKMNKKKTLYVSGEESKSQVAQRAKRLNLNIFDTYIITDNKWHEVLDKIKFIKPEIIIIDSIQTMKIEEISGSAGSVSQIKEVTSELIEHIKKKNISCIVIGHINKEGSVAGPKVLEHMVDTVLYFENSIEEGHRLIRTVKNRFGKTGEVGLYVMDKEGLKKEAHSDSTNTLISSVGSSRTLVNKGSRYFYIECESLVNKNKSGHVKRVCKGVDNSRVQMLLAVIEKNLSISFEYNDLYLKLKDYVKTDDSDIDLSIIASIISSYSIKKLSSDTLFIGEVALNGDIKSSRRIEEKLNHIDVKKYKKVILNREISKKFSTNYNIKMIGLKNINELPHHI